MNISKKDKVAKCPTCGSDEIHTMGLDQICLDCDWNNFKYLVDQGQLDNIASAEFKHFNNPDTFEDLEDPASEALFAMEA